MFPILKLVRSFDVWPASWRASYWYFLSWKWPVSLSCTHWCLISMRQVESSAVREFYNDNFCGKPINADRSDILRAPLKTKILNKNWNRKFESSFKTELKIIFWDSLVVARRRLRNKKYLEKLNLIILWVLSILNVDNGR